MSFKKNRDEEGLGDLVRGDTNQGVVFDLKGQSSKDGFMSGSYRGFKGEYNYKEKSLFIGITTEPRSIDYGSSKTIYEK